MSRDFKIFLSTLSEARFSEGIAALGLISLSADARRRRRRFRQLRGVFEATFTEPDSAIQLSSGRDKLHPPRAVVGWLGVGMLFTCVLFIWVRITTPGLSEWFTTVMHRCGLK